MIYKFAKIFAQIAQIAQLDNIKIFLFPAPNKIYAKK